MRTGANQLFGCIRPSGVVSACFTLLFIRAFNSGAEEFLTAKKNEGRRGRRREPILRDPMLSPHWRKVGRFIINHNILVSLAAWE